MAETLGVLAIIATVIFIAFFYRYLFRRAWEQDMEDAKRISEDRRINMSPQIGIAELVRRVATEISMERGAICAVDCLRQWDEGGKKLLKRTIQVWEERLAKPDGSYTDAERHGAWVPAIPLE